MFSIECKYTSGDSFGTETNIETIPLSWEEIEKCKEALSCMIEHHNYLKQFEDKSYSETLILFEEIKNKKWFKYDGGLVDWMYSICLENDNGDLKTIGVFWEDFFGHLISFRMVGVDYKTEYIA